MVWLSFAADVEIAFLVPLLTISVENMPSFHTFPNV